MNGRGRNKGEASHFLQLFFAGTVENFETFCQHKQKAVFVVTFMWMLKPFWNFWKKSYSSTHQGKQELFKEENFQSPLSLSLSSVF